MTMMDIKDAKAVIKDLSEKPFICSEHTIETDSGYVITTKEKSKYARAKKQTNADRIRAMTDEQLADFLEGFEACNGCEYKDKVTGFCTFGNPCVHGFAQAIILKWLQSEAEQKGKV